MDKAKVDQTEQEIFRITATYNLIATTCKSAKVDALSTLVALKIMEADVTEYLTESYDKNPEFRTTIEQMYNEKKIDDKDTKAVIEGSVKAMLETIDMLRISKHPNIIVSFASVINACQDELDQLKRWREMYR